jgi:thiosulfate dehydrogenase [quinone] large subunit
VVGLFFIIFGEYKVFGTEFTLGGGFENSINGFLKSGAYPFMVPVLKGFVLEFAKPIAFLVAYGELAIGLALLLGVYVRLASIFGLLLMVSLLFSAAYPGPNQAFWIYWAASLSWSFPALCFAAFIIGPGEEIWSVKKWLPQKAERIRRQY